MAHEALKGLARFGGEEFVVLLPEINAQGATVVAEKIRTAVEFYPFAGRHTQPGGQLTVALLQPSSPGNLLVPERATIFDR